MVGTVGLEPMTSCMSSMRSNQLSYAPELFYSTTAGKQSQVYRAIFPGGKKFCRRIFFAFFDLTFSALPVTILFAYLKKFC